MESRGTLKANAPASQKKLHLRIKMKWKSALPLYVMMVPTLAYFLILTYYPLGNAVLISLQNYHIIGDRTFVGFQNYAQVLTDEDFWHSFANTLVLGFGILTIGFVAPIVIAISINELLQSWLKKTVQLIIYVPHLFSWVVVGGMWIYLLTPDTGLVNAILKMLGVSQIHFMSDANLARWVLILVTVWKDVGYNCILYLAGIVAINPALYEAARVDGANRWHEIWHITLPGLVRTMKVVGLLSIMGIFRLFDQIYVMRNPVIQPKVDVLMTYVYDLGFQQMDTLGQATASAILILLFTLFLTFITRRFVRYSEV